MYSDSGCPEFKPNFASSFIMDPLAQSKATVSKTILLPYLMLVTHPFLVFTVQTEIVCKLSNIVLHSDAINSAW